MKKRIPMIALVASLLMACSSGSNQQETLSAGVLPYDSLSIPIDYPCLGFYYQMTHYIEGNTLYWAGYNHLLHSIEVFDLTNCQTVASYELESDGPDAIIKNQFDNFLMNDSLFVFRGYRDELKLLSRKDGKLSKTIFPLSAEETYQLHFRGMLNGEYSGGFGMRWDGECVVMPLFAKNGQKMDDPLLLSVNIKTSGSEKLSLAYPESMKDDLGKYGSLTCPSFTLGPDRVVYNFAHASQVYVAMREPGEVRTFAMNSNATPNRSDSKDTNIKQRDFRGNFEYEENALRFGVVNYDKSSDAYIRIHYAKREEVMGRREAYLMVYKCRTGEMLEYELPEEISARYFVADGHAYFLLKNNDDICLHFAVVNLKEL